MRYDVHPGSCLHYTALVYCSSWSTFQLMSLRMIICWLSLLLEMIEPLSARNVDARLCRNLDPVRPGAYYSLRLGYGSISMAPCNSECWLRCAEALMTSIERRCWTCSLVWSRTIRALPVLSSIIMLSVVLGPRRNGRILGTVAEIIFHKSSIWQCGQAQSDGCYDPARA